MNKNDLKQIGDLIKSEFAINNEKFEEKLGRLIDIKVDKEFNELDKKLFDWKSEIINSVDSMVKEINEEREFRTVVSHQITEHRERIDGLGKKVFGGIQSAA